MKLRFNKEITLLILIIVLGLTLRLWKWPDYLVFDYEKSRDLIDSLSIYTTHKLTLIGPTTEVDGIYHGPLYYYILGFFFFITGGDPRAASIVSFGFNLLGVGVLYFIGKSLFNKSTGLIAAFLYAISFESISYAYWLSNPGPSVPFIFLTFFFLYKFLIEKSRGFNKFLPLSLFCFGVTIQFQILNVIFLPALIAMYLLSIKPVSFKTLGVSLIAFFIPISTFLVFESRHEFLMIKNAFNKIILPAINEGKDSPASYLDFFPRIIQYSSSVFSPPSYWAGVLIFLIIIGFVVFKLWKKSRFAWKFLAVWIFSTLPVFFVPSRMSQSHAAFIGVSGGLIIVLAYILNSLLSKSRVLVFLILGIMLIGNLYAIQNYLTHPQKRLFDYFEGLFWKTDLELVDYSFEDAGAIQFKTDTITSPRSISKLWDYLYDWRGKTKYGKTPNREGKPGIGYLILEPQLGGGEIFKEIAIKKADTEGELVEIKKFGDVVIQKRVLKYKD